MDNVTIFIMLEHLKKIKRLQINTTSKASYLFNMLKFQMLDMSNSDVLNLFGYHIRYNNYLSVRHLIKEIFLEQHYYIDLNTPTPLIFDIGSNIGITTLFLKLVYPHSRIYCFEPDPDTYKTLLANVTGNQLKNVILFNYGLGGFDGQTSLHIPSWSDGSSSIFKKKIHIEKDFASQINTNFNHTIKEKEVSIRKCSNLIKQYNIDHIDVMKIDAEGAETEIIEDMKDHLHIIDFLIIEYHYSKDFLRENSLSRIVHQLENSDFIVTTKPTWTTTTPYLMSTYLIKAVNVKAMK